MYLSSIYIENYKGIKKLDVDFQKDINVIIGENGSCKTALIDAIRLLYNLGNQQKEIFVTLDDFYLEETIIIISYKFRDLTTDQKGVFYEYIVLDENEENDYARITITYKKDKQKVLFSYYTGEIEGQRADSITFQNFIHYYLGALRDSTRDLLTNRNNILSKLINRQVLNNNSQVNYETLMNKANEELLNQKEVKDSQESINTNLSNIYKYSIENQIGLRIEESKAEYIINIIKPYLPHDKENLSGKGFNLMQNSLGFNNLIYIATVLGDIKQQQKDDKASHFALLIEEPEAHLHPQLQLNLFDFLKNTNNEDNSQLFITTHSPTLTSKVPLDNLIHLSKYNHAINLSRCFESNEEQYFGNKSSSKKQLERYIDVTKSQLFYSKGVLFVEGISEEFLVPVFANILNIPLEDYKIELVNVNGTSFYPFIHLFNSTNKNNTLPMPVSILTDDDRFPKSKNKEYSFNNISKNIEKANELYNNITSSKKSNRIDNLLKLINNQNEKIILEYSFKTFEYEIVKSNISNSKLQIQNNLLWKYLNNYLDSKKISIIQKYFEKLTEEINVYELQLLHILIWKSLPKKAEFAQDFSIYILSNINEAQSSFKVPEYIEKAIKHLVNYKVK